MDAVRGFTMMQILVASAIVMLVVLIAYPNYQSHLLQARRVNAEETMMKIAAALEQYHVTNTTYETVNLAKIGYGDKTSDGAYQLSLNELQESSFTIVATPLGSQMNDKTCGVLTLTSGLEKKISGNGNASLCW